MNFVSRLTKFLPTVWQSLYVTLCRTAGIAYTIGQWAVPSGVAPSGTMGNNGAVTLGTALPATYSGGIYLYFPAGALYAESAAGSYWCVMSSTTAGTVYSNTLSGIPTSVSSPTAIVATGPGAFTGSTGEVTLGSVSVAGGSMGPSGVLQYEAEFSMGPASVSGRTFRFRLGAVQINTSTPANTNITWNNLFVMRNVAADRQISAAAGLGLAGGANAGNKQRFTIDTTQAQTLSMTAQNTTATDYSVLEGARVLLIYGA